MFKGKSSFDAGYEKEDWEQEYGVKAWSKSKKTTKNQKRDVRRWQNQSKRNMEIDGNRRDTGLGERILDIYLWMI